MPEPIYTWGFQSSKPRAGGRLITYLIQLGEDGKMSCDCPGWIFKKKGVNRDCKHTRNLKTEAKEVFKVWSDGGVLTLFEEETDSAKDLAGIDRVTRKGPAAEYSRSLDLDD